MPENPPSAHSHDERMDKQLLAKSAILPGANPSVSDVPTTKGWTNIIVDDADRPDIHLFSIQGERRSTMRILKKDIHVRSHSEDSKKSQNTSWLQVLNISLYLSQWKAKLLENLFDISPLLNELLFL